MKRWHGGKRWQSAKAGESIGVTPEDRDDDGNLVGEDPAGFVRDLIHDRPAALSSRRATAGQASGFLGVALGTATPIPLHFETCLSEGTRGGAALQERTKVERRRAINKLVAWMEHERIAATVEAVTRRVTGRYISEVLLPSGRAPVTLGKSIHGFTTYWAWMQRRLSAAK